jgi:hypothetical protein
MRSGAKFVIQLSSPKCDRTKSITIAFFSAPVALFTPSAIAMYLTTDRIENESIV